MANLYPTAAEPLAWQLTTVRPTLQFSSSHQQLEPQTKVCLSAFRPLSPLKNIRKTYLGAQTPTNVTSFTHFSSYKFKCNFVDNVFSSLSG